MIASASPDDLEDIFPFAALPGSSDTSYGVCPECRHHDGFLTIGPGSWFVCHLHQTKWYVGDYQFLTWRYETEAHWRRNALRIADYREVLGNPEFEPVWRPESESSTNA